LLRDELLEREAFDTLLEAKVLIERWRQHYNEIRPHSALGFRPGTVIVELADCPSTVALVL